MDIPPPSKYDIYHWSFSAHQLRQTARLWASYQTEQQPDPNSPAYNHNLHFTKEELWKIVQGVEKCSKSLNHNLEPNLCPPNSRIDPDRYRKWESFFLSRRNYSRERAITTVSSKTGISQKKIKKVLKLHEKWRKTKQENDLESQPILLPKDALTRVHPRNDVQSRLFLLHSHRLRSTGLGNSKIVKNTENAKSRLSIDIQKSQSGSGKPFSKFAENVHISKPTEVTSMNHHRQNNSGNNPSETEIVISKLKTLAAAWMKQVYPQMVNDGDFLQSVLIGSETQNFTDENDENIQPSLLQRPTILPSSLESERFETSTLQKTNKKHPKGYLKIGTPRPKPFSTPLSSYQPTTTPHTPRFKPGPSTPQKGFETPSKQTFLITPLKRKLIPEDLVGDSSPKMAQHLVEALDLMIEIAKMCSYHRDRLQRAKAMSLWVKKSCHES